MSTSEDGSVEAEAGQRDVSLKHILYVSENPGLFDFSCLGAGWQVTRVEFPITGRRVPVSAFSHVVVDVNLSRSSNALYAKDILRRVTGNGRLLIACDERRVHSQYQAWSLGADALLYRPINHLVIRAAILDAARRAPRSSLDAVTAAAGDTLAQLFSAAEVGSELEIGSLSETTDAITSSIRSAGLQDWLASVGEHHDGTYQHCLMVAGLAAAFSKEIGLSSNDQRKVTLAALVHDVGKIRIPYNILETPTNLTASEFELIKKHPRYGWEFMQGHSALDSEVVDAVLHHHEMLDGSGYPDGLAGGQITDLNRIMTICDVFGALLERRAYKPSMSAVAAFDVLSGMGREGKLELPLLRAFEPLVIKAGPTLAVA